MLKSRKYYVINKHSLINFYHVNFFYEVAVKWVRLVISDRRRSWTFAKSKNVGELWEKRERKENGPSANSLTEGNAAPLHADFVLDRGTYLLPYSTTVEFNNNFNKWIFIYLTHFNETRNFSLPKICTYMYKCTYLMDIQYLWIYLLYMHKYFNEILLKRLIS